jgi:hypothetical protein
MSEAGRAIRPHFRLIRDLRIYLNGFRSRGIQAKVRKDPQKAVGEKYEDPALTIRALTMMRPYAKRMIC